MQLYNCNSSLFWCYIWFILKLCTYMRTSTIFVNEILIFRLVLVNILTWTFLLCCFFCNCWKTINDSDFSYSSFGLYPYNLLTASMLLLRKNKNKCLYLTSVITVTKYSTEAKHVYRCYTFVKVITTNNYIHIICSGVTVSNHDR